MSSDGKKYLGLIPARSGSKGIPGKNLKPLAGRALVLWTAQAALGAHRLDRVILSTDDEVIASVGRQGGLEVPFLRPIELALDATPQIDVARHALSWLAEKDGYSPDYLVLLQPTSPLRTSADIDAAIELAGRETADAVVGVVPARDHPFLVKKVLADGSLASFVAELPASLRRQDLPLAYALNGAIYINRVESLLEKGNFVPAGAFPYVMPEERSLDIDDLWDWKLAEMILRNTE